MPINPDGPTTIILRFDVNESRKTMLKNLHFHTEACRQFVESQLKLEASYRVKGELYTDGELHALNKLIKTLDHYIQLTEQRIEKGWQ